MIYHSKEAAEEKAKMLRKSGYKARIHKFHGYSGQGPIYYSVTIGGKRKLRIKRK